MTPDYYFFVPCHFVLFDFDASWFPSYVILWGSLRHLDMHLAKSSKMALIEDVLKYID